MKRRKVVFEKKDLLSKHGSWVDNAIMGDCEYAWINHTRDLRSNAMQMREERREKEKKERRPVVRGKRGRRRQGVKRRMHGKRERKREKARATVLAG